MRLMLRLLLFAALPLSTPASALAQQQVRVKIDGAGGKSDLPAQLYRPAATPAPAVAIFHGCGGVGAHNTRMGPLRKSWGHVPLVGGTFPPPRPKDLCGR